jgi:hypothetical protein
LRAPRANRVSSTDEKRIRRGNTVIDKNKVGLGWLFSEILDSARMRFSSVRYRGSARTVFRARKVTTLQQRGGAILVAARIGNN